ncbi:hypothetical protein EWM64_g5652 [Hericium alpestre]|uniref:Uncharacterized protein n=1 Tax=Hericium alpestre TaxID=135208 RepID=A0A4Y9ZU79_9AGAM|nr:hypothetical protein EWM64_g5652 [Hericium alpestre]
MAAPCAAGAAPMEPMSKQLDDMHGISMDAQVVDHRYAADLIVGKEELPLHMLAFCSDGTLS